MKLRIHDNSLRLRLTQKEVAQFRRSGRVDAAICFAPGQVLSYAMESLEDVAEVSAYLDDGAIRIVIPTGIARAWADTDQVGIQAWQAAGDGIRLELLIEKDFGCLHRSADRDTDTYPNPLAALKP